MSNLEKAIKYRKLYMPLNIQMFADIYISTHSTYWQSSGTNTPNPQIAEYRPYFDFYYSQNEQGQTIYKMDVYAQLDGATAGLSIGYNVTCSIAGESFNRTGSYKTISGSYQKVYLFSVTKTVNCNADGSGVGINYSLYGTVNTNSPSYYPSRGTASYNFTPPTVQLNAKLGIISDFTIGTDFNIPATIYNTGYTHTLTIKIGNVVIGTRNITSSNTTINFSNEELTTIYNNSTTTNTPIFTFELVTINGSSQIGSTSSATAKGTLTDVKPFIDGIGISISDKLMGNSVIKGISLVLLTITMTPKKNATIKKVLVNGIEATLYGDMASISFEKCTTGTFEVIVIDSRENSTTQTATKNFIPYIPLTAKASFSRESSTSGTINLSYEGNYYNGSLGSENNELTLSWKYKLKSDTNWTTGGTLTPTISGNTYSGNTIFETDFYYKNDYDFAIDYADKIISDTIQYSVNKGEGSLEVYKEAVVVNGILDINGTIKVQNDSLYSNGNTIIDSNNSYANKKFGTDKELATLEDINSIFKSYETNYIEFSNGLKICWGIYQPPNANGYFSIGSFDFPIMYESKPTIVATKITADNSIRDTRQTVSAEASTTGATIKVEDSGAQSNGSYSVNWIAIGY